MNTPELRTLDEPTATAEAVAIVLGSMPRPRTPFIDPDKSYGVADDDSGSWASSYWQERGL